MIFSFEEVVNNRHLVVDTEDGVVRILDHVGDVILVVGSGVSNALSFAIDLAEAISDHIDGEEKERLENEIDYLDGEVSYLNDSICKLEEEISDLEEEIGSLESKISELETEVEDLSRELSEMLGE